MQPLLKGLDSLDWPAGVKAMQSNWIGQSDGAYFDFSLRHTPDYHPPSFPPTLPHHLPPLRVFTTRPDTMYGVSFIAISPEHELLRNSEVREGRGRDGGRGERRWGGPQAASCELQRFVHKFLHLILLSCLSFPPFSWPFFFPSLDPSSLLLPFLSNTSSLSPPPSSSSCSVRKYRIE